MSYSMSLKRSEKWYLSRFSSNLENGLNGDMVSIHFDNETCIFLPCIETSLFDSPFSPYEILSRATDTCLSILASFIRIHTGCAHTLINICHKTV